MHKVLLFPRFTSAEWDDAYAQGKIKALWNTTLDRNAVVEAHSGTLIVNGGTFYAKSSADAFQRTIAGLDQYPFVEQQADVDNDHSVTVVDATYIQRYLAGLSHPIGIGAFG